MVVLVINTKLEYWTYAICYSNICCFFTNENSMHNFIFNTNVNWKCLVYFHECASGSWKESVEQLTIIWQRWSSGARYGGVRQPSRAGALVAPMATQHCSCDCWVEVWHSVGEQDVQSALQHRAFFNSHRIIGKCLKLNYLKKNQWTNELAVSVLKIRP